jgi:hypothetical protein
MYHKGCIDAIIVEDARSCELRPSVKDLGFTMDSSSVEELVKFLEGCVFETSVCKVCGAKMLNHAGHYRTSDECDTCCKERITKESNARMREQMIAEAAEELEMYRKGYRFKTVAWVHGGGDDYSIVMFSEYKPSDLQIKTKLRKEGSRVLDDYGIKELRGVQQ